ncbi:hypothetical protein OpiT1DRAFT_04728 [Opitutaceae bacterium TAV1]|nr:hypothetical protein OPIT5_25545 [Opitutaceae bacterium TAV5]EIQ00186.1 hypothetical protein OpiT1DRAFT_04728 [Opitutaceae bacterium TAV1]
MQTKSRFEAPESESLRKFVVHIIDEMPRRVVAAIVFVSFFFFYGATNAALKFAAGEAGTLDHRIGPAVGAVFAIATLIALVSVKRRRQSQE